MTKNGRDNHQGPYTAIVVGSGCSVGLGVPVMAGFLDTLIDELAKKADTGSKESLARIQAFITRVKGAAAYVKADLLNIEELYGMADMDEDLWRADGEQENWYRCRCRCGHSTPADLNPMQVKRALNRAIFSLAEPAGKEFITSQDRFPRNLKELEEVKRESATETPLHRNRGTRWTNLLAYLCLASFQDRDKSRPLFIQFNWDLALDRALFCFWHFGGFTDPNSVKISPDKHWLDWYVCDAKKEIDHSTYPHLARPHGGINWINNEFVKQKSKNEHGTSSGPSDDKKERQITGDDYTKLEKFCFKLHPTNEDIWVDTAPVYQRKPSSTIWRNGESMEIVPPTWRKQATKPAYKAQWGHISQGLQGVRRIVFVGYSLPKTDLYFRHFLALSLADNPYLPKVYVINPHIDEDGGVRDNFLDLFAPLAREGRLYGIKGRFGNPALFDLHRALSIAKKIKP